MAQVQTPYAAGTATVAAGGTTVTVTGLLDDTNCQEGDIFRNPATGTETAVLARVDATHFTIDPWRGAAMAAAAYQIYPRSTLRVSAGRNTAVVNQLVQRLKSQGLAWYLPSGYASPTAAGWGADEGQYVYQDSSKTWWVMTSGAWQVTGGPMLGYGGTSTSSILIPTSTPVTRAFTTQAGLGYDGMRVRATAIANRANWIEGIATYSGTSLSIAVDAFGGSGTFNSWTFGIAGQPGNMTGSNNGSEFTDPEAVRKTVYAAPFDAMGALNLINNGDSSVSQRYGRSLRPLTSGVPLYGIDCNPGYFTAAATLAVSVGQYDNASFAAPQGFNFSNVLFANTGLASLSGTDKAYLSYYIEGYDAARLGWGTAQAQPITVSFWSKAYVGGQASVFAGNATKDRRVTVPFTRASNALWQYHQVTIPGCQDGTWDVANGIGIEIGFVACCGSGAISSTQNWRSSAYVAYTGQTNFFNSDSNHFGITGVSAFPGNEGPNAARSPYIFRSFATELDRCKRYYEKSYGYATSAPSANNANGAVVKQLGTNTIVQGMNYGSTSFNIQKRIAPTMRVFDFAGSLGRVSDATPTTLGAGTGMTSVVGENGFGVYNNSGATKTTTNSLVLFQWDAEAGL